MDYFFEDEHHALRDEVRDFAERVVRPRVAELEARQTVEHGLAREIAAQGWIGVTIPRRYGGMELGHLAKTIVIEELARVSGAMGAMAQASQLGVAKVLHFGTEHQKARWLPLFATGELLPTIAVTEPESGGHVLGMTSIERYLRDVIHTFPAAGTSDIQRLRLAEVALGRYRAVSSTVSGVPSRAFKARSTEQETQVKVGVSRFV